MCGVVNGFWAFFGVDTHHVLLLFGLSIFSILFGVYTCNIFLCLVDAWLALKVGTDCNVLGPCFGLESGCQLTGAVIPKIAAEEANGSGLFLGL